MGTKINPGRFDCHGRALADEPLFTLLARDPAAPKAIEVWAGQRAAMIERGDAPASDYAMLTEAIECAGDMARWRAENMGRWRREAPPPTHDPDQWWPWAAHCLPPRGCDVLVAKMPEGWWTRATIFELGPLEHGKGLLMHGGRWTPTHWKRAPALPGGAA